MRQVMPHRNNIGADRRGCKTFLHGMGSRPPNSGDCCNPVPTQPMASNDNKPCYNNGL
jgi:hypothetical protein